MNIITDSGAWKGIILISDSIVISVYLLEMLSLSHLIHFIIMSIVVWVAIEYLKK